MNMNLIDKTAKERKELLAFCKPKLSAESYCWLRNTFNDLNRRLMNEEEDPVFLSRVYTLYKNTGRFFREHTTSLEAGHILLTFYICFIQMNVKEFGDTVESLKDFTDLIDMGDWKDVNYEVLCKLDTNMFIRLVSNTSNEDKFEVSVAGLATLTGLTFI